MSVHDLDALGAQYRQARDGIGAHRRRQAKAELRLARARRQHPEASPEVAAARQAIDRATADVRWCQAATVAAGEAIKGEPIEAVLERNEAHRNRLPHVARALDLIDRQGGE